MIRVSVSNVPPNCALFNRATGLHGTARLMSIKNAIDFAWKATIINYAKHKKLKPLQMTPTTSNTK